MNNVNANSRSEGGVARIHATIKHNGQNQQYAVLQTPTDYQGIGFNVIIDSGAKRSFISLGCVSKLSLPSFWDSTLIVKLATGKTTQSLQKMGNIHFKIGGHQTHATFRVLALGTYEGLKGMDWLVQHKAVFACHSGKLKFKDAFNQEAKIFGNRGDPALHLIFVIKILKHYCKKKMIIP